MRSQQGLSLVEMLLAVILLGIVSIAMSPAFHMLAASSSVSYASQQTAVNEEIRKALEDYARTRTDTNSSGASQAGHLPMPVAINAMPYRLPQTDPLLMLLMQQHDVTAEQMEDDDSSARRLRMYQLVPNLTQTVPLYFQSGPQVTINYEYGVLYMTACSAWTGKCDRPYSTSSTPAIAYASNGGYSGAMTVTNYQGFKTTPSDLAPTFVSSLPVQMQMLKKTADRLDRVRDALLNYARVKQLAAAASDLTTDWFPIPSTATAQNHNPNTDAGCIDNWYSLATTDILPQIGLTQQEYGVTGWGAPVEYCPNYDSTGLLYSGPAARPHYGALRINNSVSLDLAPDTANSNNNMILTF